MEKNYKIIKLAPTRQLVIVLSYELSMDEYVEIQHKLGQVEKTTLYFDFLISNGMSNRFYSVAASSLTRNKRFKMCSHFPAKYKKISNDFFRKHYRFIEYSVLSSRQKEYFK